MGNLTVKDSSIVRRPEEVEESAGVQETHRTDEKGGLGHQTGGTTLQNEKISASGRVPKGVFARNSLQGGTVLTAHEKAAIETAINAMPGTQASTAVDESDAIPLFTGTT